MNELKELLPYISLLLTFAAFYFARKKDTEEDAASITRVSVKMDEIAHDMGEMKTDLKAIREEARVDHDKLVLVSAKVNALGDRVDEIKSKLNQ